MAILFPEHLCSHVIVILKEDFVDLNQLRKAFTERTELEYLFDNNQWLPAAIKLFQERSSHSPTIILQLLQYPREHSGTILLTNYDLEHRLRIKGSN